MQRNKVLYITTRLFWPADSGRKVSLYHYCKGLHDQLGFDVYLYSFLEAGQSLSDAEKAPDFIQEVQVASDLTVLEKAKNAFGAIFDTNRPLQCCLYFSKENSRRIKEMADRVNPSVVIIDMIRLAPYIDSVKNFPIVMNFDDLLSKRYQRQAMQSGKNVLGKYEEKASSFVLSILSNSFLNKLILKIESSRVAKAERKFALEADACLFVSPGEADEMNKRLLADKCFSATLGAEIDDRSNDLKKTKYDFAFVGNLYTAANQDSVRTLIEQIMPYMPDTQLRIIGVCPETFSEEFAGRDNISFSGRVDSVATELKLCRVMLAPFAYGTGIKTKVLESMALGIPVVTNSIGIEGLMAAPGIELVVEDGYREFAKAALDLLNDEANCKAIGQAGRHYIERNHSWSKSINDLDDCIEYARKANSQFLA